MWTLSVSLRARGRKKEETEGDGTRLLCRESPGRRGCLAAAFGAGKVGGRRGIGGAGGREATVARGGGTRRRRVTVPVRATEMAGPCNA